MKFELGSWYSFSIIGLTNIPEKGDHFILLHESGRKMLMNAEYYRNYKLSVEQNIKCKVDKINCTGQVFLEPEHPFYKEGSIYNFKFLGFKSNQDNTKSIIVRDFYENEIQLFCKQEDAELFKNRISLKVDKIKKGIPVLSYLKEEKSSTKHAHHSDNLVLRLTSMVNVNSEDYYSLSDKKGVVAWLQVKHYMHYGFKIGSNIKCTKRGYESNGLLVVEPENPWYKVGFSYKFKLNNFENYMDLEGNNILVGIVLDVNENKCAVTINEIYHKLHKNNHDINCKVLGFRKGRPQLEIDQNNDGC